MTPTRSQQYALDRPVGWTEVRNGVAGQHVNDAGHTAQTADGSYHVTLTIHQDEDDDFAGAPCWEAIVTWHGDFATQDAQPVEKWQPGVRARAKSEASKAMRGAGHLPGCSEYRAFTYHLWRACTAEEMAMLPRLFLEALAR